MARWTWKGAGWLAVLLLVTRCGVAGAPEQAGEARALLAREETWTFTPTADTGVNNASRDANAGGSAQVLVDGGPDRFFAFARFEVAGLTGRVTRATLRFYVTEGSNDGPPVYLTENAWEEQAVTWNQQPQRFGTALADPGLVPAKAWLEYDVTRAVTGNGPYSFGLYPTSGDGLILFLREARADLRPQLVITTGPLPPPVECRSERMDIDHALDAAEDVSVYRNSATPFVDPQKLRVGDFRLSHAEAYLRFDLTQVPIPQPLARARLRLFALEAAADTPTLYRTEVVGSPSDLAALTWEQRPALQGLPVDDHSEALSRGSWLEYDVSSVVQGTGTYGFGLLPERPTGAVFSSKQDPHDAQRPKLLLTQRLNVCAYRGSGGGLVWAQRRGGSQDAQVTAMVMDGSGAFVTAGRSAVAFTSGHGGFALAKYGADGTRAWSRTYSDTRYDVRVLGLALSPSGDIRVLGSYHNGAPPFGSGSIPGGFVKGADLFLASFSPSGEPQWARGLQASEEPAYPFPLIASADSVTSDPEGNVLITGGFFGRLDLGAGVIDVGHGGVDDPRAFPAMFLAKYGPEGQLLWSRTWPAGHGGSRARVVRTDSLGNVLLGGLRGDTSSPGLTPHPSVGEPFVAKLTPEGQDVWTRTLPGALGAVTALAVLPGDAVAFGGSFSGAFTFAGQPLTQPSAGGTRDLFIGTLSPSGTDRWARSLGSAGEEALHALAMDASGGFVLNGETRAPLDLGGGPLGDPALPATEFLARYGEDGTHRWSRMLPPSLDVQSVGTTSAGGVRLGTVFSSIVRLEGRTFTSAGGGDVLLLELAP